MLYNENTSKLRPAAISLQGQLDYFQKNTEVKVIRFYSKQNQERRFLHYEQEEGIGVFPCVCYDACNGGSIGSNCCSTEKRHHKAWHQSTAKGQYNRSRGFRPSLEKEKRPALSGGK